MEAEVHTEQAQDVIAFPSSEWFEQLAQLMKINRTPHEHLGYIDCVAQFTVLDGGLGGKPWTVQVTFEDSMRPMCAKPAPVTSRAPTSRWRHRSRRGAR